jgi:hypothetical protein
LKSDGTLWAMGANFDGQLGDGTTTSRINPVPWPAMWWRWRRETWHSLYLKSDGTLWAMGYNGYGQLGDGTTTNRSNAGVRGQQCGGGGGGRDIPCI